MTVNCNLSRNRTQSRQKIKNKNSLYTPKMVKADTFSSPPNGSTGPAALSPKRNRSKNLGMGTSAGKRSPRSLSNSQSLHHLLRNQVQSVIARFVFDFFALFATIFLFLSSFSFPSIIFSSFDPFYSLFFLSWLLNSPFPSYLPSLIRYSFNLIWITHSRQGLPMS